MTNSARNFEDSPMGAKDMSDERLQILISKYVDGEVTAQEQRQLHLILEQNEQARELFEQLKRLHERSTEAVRSAVIAKGAGPREVFERALRTEQLRPVAAGNWGSWRVFAAGLAAGLLLGLGAHFAAEWFGQVESKAAREPVIVQTEPGQNKIATSETARPDELDRERGVIRNVDFFNFTSADGQQWLLEGLRERMVQHAVYQGDL